MAERKLTLKQQRFIDEYLIDGNGTQAAIRAGYSKRGADVTAFHLLRNIRIARQIEQRRAKLAARLEEKLELDAENIIRSVMDIRAQAIAAGDHGPALKANEMLGRVLVNHFKQQNPLLEEPIGLKHQFGDDEEMSSNDLARELAFALTLEMRRAERNEETPPDPPIKH